MKDGSDRYSSKKRYIDKGYFRKSCDGSSGKKAHEASRSDSIQHSKEKQEEEIEMLVRPELPLCLREVVDKEIEWYAKVVQLTDEEIVYTGKEDEREGNIDQRSRDDEGLIKSVVVMPDIPKKRARRKRKAAPHKKDD